MSIGNAGFTAAQKYEILRVGNYKCAICGATEASGISLDIYHIKPLSKGDKSEINNGQILCSEHNDQTEMGKEFFTDLHKLAKEHNDSKLIAFVEDVLQVYETHQINSHIE